MDRKVRYGISLVADRLSEYPGWVRLAEESGFDMIGLTDSPSVYPETYITGVLCAQNTSRIRFGPRVTNPLTRNPMVTASAIAGLDELSKGRAILGIGTGDSAAFHTGNRPASVKKLGEYALAVRGLLRGEEITYNGKQLRLMWTKRNVPIYLAAAGPKTLRLAAQIADGIIIGTGVSPDIVKATLATIHDAAKEAGRDPNALDLWWLCGCRVGPTRHDAIEDAKSFLAAACNATFQVSLDNKHLPKRLYPAVERLCHEYNFWEHVKPGRDAQNARLVERDGLKEYLAERFLVGGTPEDCARKIKESAAAGATQFWWTVNLPDKAAFIRAFSKDVMPLVASKSTATPA